MKVRIWKRTAVVLLVLNVVFLCCTGCKEKKGSGLQTLTLQERQEDKAAAQESTESEGLEPDEGADASAGEKTAAIFVYVCGAVNAPGVYELEAGARIYEAIACAGGVREDAAEESVNQAQIVADGERVYIPTDEEAAQGMTEIVLGSTDSGASDGKVNLNTASKEELMTLNGIGESRAESIIGYREAHGAFQSIEELMNVEGIKEGVFRKIQDRITVSAGS